ncbi:unnamed protein product [Adineta ricciae]|uniref:Fe2OG dioxygenase domain-containing protein n=1 Tax=Adineta ricciae TaxID=249248 RepID=A0A815UFA3_ADIRI|nr:unnamed protein product [Adineta ricciae]
MRCAVKVFFGFIAVVCLLEIYRLREIFFQTTEQAIHFIQSKFCKKDPQVSKIDNYDLSQYKYQCPRHRYASRIIERSPLIIYIEQFLTKNEIRHLLKLTERNYEHSAIFESNGGKSFNKYRTSTSAFIKTHETPIVECIERRFAQFQGDVDVDCIEPLQVVRYTNDQQYDPHVDWLTHPDTLKNGGQRVTTYFTYLQVNCSMGETEFVAIKFNKSLHERFCDILICDEESTTRGLRFRPLPGNTIFWYNMNEYAEPDALTIHAGRPPGKDGVKIGLNVWTRLDKFT